MECLDKVLLFATVVLSSVVKGLDRMDVFSADYCSLSLDVAKPQSIRETPFHK